MSDRHDFLSNCGIDVTGLAGGVTPVTPDQPAPERCLPFTVVSFQEPSEGEPWHGCGCVFPEGEYFSPTPCCWIIPPYCRHRFLRFDKRHTSTWGHFDFTLSQNLDLLHFYDTPRFLAGEKADRIKELLLAIDFTGARDPVTFCRSKAAGLEILGLILESSTLLREDAEEILHPFFMGIFQYIRNNLHKRIVLDDIAAFAGVSRSLLEKKFRRILGISPGEFILRVRLNEAAWLLRSTAKSAKEIAESTGFTDVYTFSKAFRRKFGRPPICFRKEIKKPAAQNAQQAQDQKSK